MAEEEGLPTFDSSSSFFTFPATGQAGSGAVPDESIDNAEDGHDQSQAQQEDFPKPATEPPRVSEDEVLVDLIKYGLPDALAKLNNQVAPITVLAIIGDSVDNIRNQVDAEREVRRRQEHIERQNAPEEQQHQSKDETLQSFDKGKGIEGPQNTPVSAPASSVASDNIDTASVHTLSQGQFPSADAQSEAETDVPKAEDTGPDSSPIPRPKVSSTSAIPRRRDLIKAMFRKVSDADTRSHVLRRSAGALQLKAKLKYARHIWQGEVQTAFVSLLRSFTFPLTHLVIRGVYHRLCSMHVNPRLLDLG